MTAAEKPRYPARFFNQLRKYPRKSCTVCGRLIMPRLLPSVIDSEQLESLEMFNDRDRCDTCPPPVRRQRKTKPKQSATSVAPKRPRRIQGDVTVPSDARAALRQALALDHLPPEYFIGSDERANIHQLQGQATR